MTNGTPLTELEKLQKKLRRGQTMFITAGEATGYGYDIEEGWMLKLRGGVDGGQPNLTVVSPDKWEMIPDTDLVISPEGKQYTRDELSILYERERAELASLPEPPQVDIREPQPEPIKPPTQFLINTIEAFAT